MTLVALTRCEGYDRSQVRTAVQRQFELLGVDRLVRRGDHVLIKPNMIAPRPARSAVQTDPVVITEVARALLDLGARPVVGDSPAWGTLANCARVLGLDDMLRPLAVTIAGLNRPRRCTLADGRTTVPISSVALDADVVLNLPKFKAHQQLMFTFAVKNLFGCVPGKVKPFWHLARGGSTRQFSTFLIQLCQRIRPALTLIDAVVAMEGAGPINGRPKRIGYLIGSVDPIAAELACAQLVGVEPLSVPVIAAAEAFGIVPELTRLVGDELAVCSGFEIPPLIPVRFSPARVARSVFTGLWMVLMGQSRSKDDTLQ